MNSATSPQRQFPLGLRVLCLAAFSAIVVVSLGIPSLRWQLQQKIALGASLVVPASYLYCVHRRLFVPSLFFVMNAVIAPFVLAALNNIPFRFPQLYFLPSIVLYLIIAFSIPSLRDHLSWRRAGHLDRRTVGLIVTLVIGSSMALVVWAFFIKGDLSRYREFVPMVPFPLLVLYGLTFAIVNSCFEEFLARAVLFDGFATLFNSIVSVIVAQALVFAIWHVNGFPGGLIGMGMVFVWSLFLGAIRHLSRGMLAPLIAHFFADSTIALILLFALNLG